MNRVSKVSKEQLISYLMKGYSTRAIGKEVGLTNETISYHIRKYGLTNLYKYKPRKCFVLDSINTKELAYTIGFIIADGSVVNEKVNIRINPKDRSVLELIAKTINANVTKCDRYNKEKRIFPSIAVIKTIVNIHKFIGGNNKKTRNVPIISKELEPYLIRGLFDADGCITWGRRKDRNRIWHKVMFSSQYNILEPIQNVLYKIGISTKIRPVKNEDCFVLEFANKEDVLKFFDYIYQDSTFIPLKRKYLKFQALRLELGIISEDEYNAILNDDSQAETTGKPE